MTRRCDRGCDVRARWRRAGPWITPVLVVVELVLVLGGVLSLTDAVIVVVELALAVAAVSRGLAAMRRFGHDSGAGTDAWTAAENGLAEMAPRPVARAIVIEVRIWVCLLRWVARRRLGGEWAFEYGRSVRPLLMIVLGLVVLEGAVVDGVPVAILGHGSVWVWVAFGLHVYGLVWVAGFLASLRVEAHRLTPTAVRLGDSVFTKVGCRCRPSRRSPRGDAATPVARGSAAHDRRGRRPASAGRQDDRCHRGRASDVHPRRRRGARATGPPRPGRARRGPGRAVAGRGGGAQESASGRRGISGPAAPTTPTGMRSANVTTASASCSSRARIPLSVSRPPLKWPLLA